MIVEFSSPYVANKAIDCNTIWDSAVLTTVLYDRAARIRQCHRCQKYGHIGRTCSDEPKCVYCAGNHLSPECPGKKDAAFVERKCANCGGAHAAWSKRCKDFEAELDRVKELEMRRERYHRIPAYLSISDPAPRMAGSSSLGSGISREPVSLNPTPREAAASLGSGQGPATIATTRSQHAPSQRTSSAKSKPAAAAKKTASKPASVATGGNATSIATRSMASQPSETSITRTPDNQQTRDAECFPMDIDVDIEFDNPDKQAGLYQSKHAPLAPEQLDRSQYGQEAAPRHHPRHHRHHRASAIAGKRQKTTAAEGDSEVSWNPPSSSSVLAEINSNGSVARKASKPTAPGKENRMKRKHLEIRRQPIRPREATEGSETY